MKKGCLWMMLWVVNVFVFLSSGYGATLEEKNSLRALPGVHVRSVDFTSVPPALTTGLPLEQFREQIETQLSQGGIPILHENTSKNMEGLPFLSVQGALSQIAIDYYAYTVIIKLHQQATLSGGATQPFVVTWSAGSLSTGQINQVLERIKFLVDRFITDYGEVNVSNVRTHRKELARKDML